ncbi:hypothetical protein MRB53_014442 [Persea americana]|uniref:Uncharacterized protein n=1 Tax=Persea americana TaxID=3435 RepID=A0ACC2KB18_PERAE|nr:hypothetical protein MRB53_014442 [Persea americana]
MASSSKQMPMRSSSHDLLSTSAAKPTSAKAVRSELPIVPWDALKTQTKRCKTTKITEEIPAWLPDGWKMEVRERASSKREGYRDRYYYNPNIRHRFRSRKEVESFLKTETIREFKPESKQVESPNDRHENHLRPDVKNCPAKVSWVLSNFGKGLWTPYINNEEVPDSTKNLWVAAMEDIIHDANNL